MSKYEVSEAADERCHATESLEHELDQLIAEHESAEGRDRVIAAARVVEVERKLLSMAA